MHFVPHSLHTRKRRAPFGLAGIAVAAVIGYAVTHSPTSPPRSGTPMQRGAATPAAKAVGQAQTAFGVDLLAQLTHAAPDQNVFFSPASIATVLALTMDGAGGQTRADMARTLHLSALPAKEVNDGSKALTQSYAHIPGVTLSVANALWADRGVTFAPAFQATAHDAFHADAQTLDFSSPSAADTINQWVGTHTKNHITQIVSPDVVASANVVLTNAVYFAGKWQTPFNKEGTHDAPFTLEGGSTVSVPLMAQEETRYGYQENAEFQAVRLPYGDGRFVMDVFLPRGELGKFLPTVTAEHFAQWSGAFRSTELNLFLPRWKMQYKQTLNEPLKTLGMGRAFTGAADFAPMGLPGNFISAVLHKATLDVDEQGTVATAATAVAVAASMAMRPLPPKVFRADHPFLLAITDTQSGALLFVGTVYNPKTR